MGKSFTKRFGSGGARNIASLAAAAIGRERIKRENTKKKEEERGGPNRYRRKGASLVGALLCYKGTSEAGTLPADVVCPSDPSGSIGRHDPWRPSTHWGRQEGWRLVFGSRYAISFPRGQFVKIIFQKGQIKKITRSPACAI
jgi:hypothetical protein